MAKGHHMDLLISLYIFCICAAELMGSKTFMLLQLGDYRLHASVAIFLLPIVFSINDIIVEVYGAQRARSVVRSSLFVVVLIMIFSLIATSLPPSVRFKQMESSYDLIFIQSLRISAASLVAFASAEFADVAIFSFLRKRLQSQGLWLRNNVSNILSQFLDTSIFIIVAFYALDQSISNNVSFLASIILPYWLLKCCMSAIVTPFVYLGVKYLRSTSY